MCQNSILSLFCFQTSTVDNIAVGHHLQVQPSQYVTCLSGGLTVLLHSIECGPQWWVPRHDDRVLLQGISGSEYVMHRALLSQGLPTSLARALLQSPLSIHLSFHLFLLYF